MIPRRSVLYMPGANARAMEKARGLDCDSIIFDLEDAVAADSKELGRQQVCAALEAGGYGERELVVRINGLDTPWGAEDLAATAALPIAGMLFPKVERSSQVQAIDAALEAAGQSELPRWYMLETPLALLDLRDLVSQSPKLAVLVMGTSDLVKELRGSHVPGRANLAYALQSCIAVARAHAVDILDGVHLDFRNLEGVSAACEEGRAMGFDGKTLIHPAQIEAANAAYGPDAQTVSQAQRVLEAWQAAQAEGRGVVELDGQLIENLHAAEAERTLEFARRIAARRSA
ncbi:MAG: HpcH/HpaI aldolase/citrate lyase family protein [Pseudomonadales bacterium]